MIVAISAIQLNLRVGWEGGVCCRGTSMERGAVKSTMRRRWRRWRRTDRGNKLIAGVKKIFLWLFLILFFNAIGWCFASRF